MVNYLQKWLDDCGRTRNNTNGQKGAEKKKHNIFLSSREVLYGVAHKCIPVRKLTAMK